jgi:inosine-uridine nucleoside N-ribohydrolase
MRVDIETLSTLSAGQTVCDIWHQSTLPKNCRVAMAMDVPAFWDLMLEALQRADEASPLNARVAGHDSGHVRA